MQIDGKFIVNGKIQDVWAMVLEPGTLASCIPGAEKSNPPITRLIIVWLNNQSVHHRKLQFVVVLTEITPPTFVKRSAEGKPSVN